MTADRSDPEPVGKTPTRTRSMPVAALKRLEWAGLLAVDGDQDADGSGEVGWRLTAAGESAAIDFLTSRTAPTAPWADAGPIELDGPSQDASNAAHKL